MLYYTVLSSCYTFENEKIPPQDSEPAFEESKQEDLSLPENSEEEKVPNPEDSEEEKVPNPEDSEEEKVHKNYENENEGGSDEENSNALTNTNMLKQPKQF
jgi:hypothetical protein